MAWSSCYRLHEYRDAKDSISGLSAAYEIGHVRGEYFFPKYVGKTSDLYARLRQYNDPNKCHNEQIFYRLFSEYRNLWFHYIMRSDPEWTESRLQIVHGIGDEGLYMWNRREENAYRVRPRKTW